MVGRGFLGPKVHLPIRVLPLHVESQTRYPLGGHVTRRAHQSIRLSVSQGRSRPYPSAQAPGVRSQRLVNLSVSHLPRPTALYSSNPVFRRTPSARVSGAFGAEMVRVKNGLGQTRRRLKQPLGGIFEEISNGETIPSFCKFNLC